jgi:hypothetical protein
LEKKALPFFSVHGAIAATTTGAANFQRGVVVFSLPSSKSVLLTTYLELLPTHDGIRITLQISTTEKIQFQLISHAFSCPSNVAPQVPLLTYHKLTESGENRTQLQR